MFFERCKMKKRDKNTSNQSVLVCFTAFFSSKTSTFRYLDKKNPPPPRYLLWDGATPLFMKIFNAVFAIKRGKDEIMISRKIFYAMSSRFYDEKKILGGQNDKSQVLKSIGTSQNIVFRCTGNSAFSWGSFFPLQKNGSCIKESLGIMILTDFLRVLEKIEILFHKYWWRIKGHYEESFLSRYIKVLVLK